MIILIGGESHTGKTLMAQKLLEKYKIPYLSLDHIKMGMVRGYSNCGFTQLDNDETISENLWNVIKGIIDTCIENRQHLIIEGCYLPPEKVRDIASNDIITVYITFSNRYIETNFDNIIGFENIIEKRNFQEERGKKEFIEANEALKEKCLITSMPYFEIDTNYEIEIDKVYDYIQNKIIKLRKYAYSDIDQVINR